MAPSEKREQKRKSLDRPGWIKQTSGLVACFVKDISDVGAKLLIAAPLLVPDKFVLYFTEDMKVARLCAVLSRSDNETIVTFIGRAIPPQEPHSMVEL